MTAPSRSLLSRCVLSVVGGMCWACAVWRPEGGGSGPEETALAAVLGWGLGVLPVHVRLWGPWSGDEERGRGGESSRRGGKRPTVRRYRADQRSRGDRRG